jgi:hypothetical protein
MGTGVVASSPQRSRAVREAIIEDSDGDGVVRWELGKQEMLAGLFTVIDGTSGSATTRSSADSAEVEPLAFPVEPHPGEAAGGGTILHARTTGGEDDGKVTITLARVDGTGGPAAVHFETADGSARAGVHYQASSGTVLFQPGHIFTSFDVPVIDDQTDAGGVQFTVKLSEPSGATLGAAVVGIFDNDSRPYVYLPPRSVPEGDGGPKEVVYMVPLSHSAPLPVTLHWIVRDTYFLADPLASGVLEYAVGEQEKPITLQYIADDVFSYPRRWIISITEAVNADVRLPDGVLTIIEDDPPPVMTVTGTTVSESAGSATVKVSYAQPFTFSFGELYYTEDGSATSPADYAGTTGANFQVLEGFLTMDITVPIHDDAIAEGTESFQVYVHHAGTQDVFPATVTILDDDANEPRVTIEEVTTVEGDGPGEVPVKVTLSDPATRPVTLEWRAYDMRTNDTIDAGVLELGAGERRRSLTLHYDGDLLWGRDRRIAITITKATNAIATTDGRVTIIEDELPPSIRASGAVVREGDGAAVLEVVLGAPIRDPFRSVYRTSRGTAAAAQDFESRAGTFVIPAGSTAVTITIPIVDDTIAEGTESFTVVIEGAELAEAPLVATVTVLDDDAPARRRSMRH